MHTASVSEWGQAPTYIESSTPASPPLESSDVQVKVLAAGLHRLVRGRAAGTHYSSKSLPHIPGTDGVGKTSDGKLIYFSTFATGGSFCDIVNVPQRACTPIPEGVDPVQAAAYINPALSSWMALTKRTDHLPKDFTVLILGVTSASGEIAVSVARALGASKVIGCARNAEAMSALNLDDSIVLQSSVKQTDFSKAASVDVILDYIYGPPAERLLSSIKFERAVQYVHVGGLSGTLEIMLPGSILRSNNLTIRGSGPGAWSHADLAIELPALLQAFSKMGKRQVKQVPLSQVEEAWEWTDERMVFLP